jgi:ADP-ribose pyrophosphatase YjhB (NUDIX family)
MRHTVRAVIIQDKKILLVTGHDADFYWTPGGGVEGSETIIETLRREIKEELGVNIKNYSPYYSYTYEDQKVDNFIVAIDGEIEVSEEITGYTWYSSKSDKKPSNGFINTLMPKLMSEDLIE